MFQVAHSVTQAERGKEMGEVLGHYLLVLVLKSTFQHVSERNFQYHMGLVFKSLAASSYHEWTGK